jgi:myo-inositol-1(or 4)-monophosphatase
MKTNVDWLQIFLECGENVKTHIQPLLKTTNDPQPKLGKGAGGDQMKLVDLAAEKAIVEGLLRHQISFTLVSEESGIIEYGDKASECFATIDPIDGTTNFVHRLPFYCTSIAISNEQKLSQVHAGMVTDLVHGATYTAIENKGAFCNGERIFSSTTSTLEDAVIGLDLNTRKTKEVAPKLLDLIQETKHLRHFGANALELCYVAHGLTDAFVDIRGKLRATDVAAGFLILKEAGGIITDLESKIVDIKLDPTQTLKFVASGNPQIHKTILSLIK